MSIDAHEITCPECGRVYTWQQARNVEWRCEHPDCPGNLLCDNPQMPGALPRRNMECAIREIRECLERQLPQGIQNAARHIAMCLEEFGR